jgi:hypothetical protein
MNPPTITQTQEQDVPAQINEMALSEAETVNVRSYNRRVPKSRKVCSWKQKHVKRINSGSLMDPGTFKLIIDQQKEGMAEATFQPPKPRTNNNNIFEIMSNNYQVQRFVLNCFASDDLILRKDIGQFGTVKNTSYRFKTDRETNIRYGYEFVTLATRDRNALDKIVNQDQVIIGLSGGFKTIRIESIRDNNDNRRESTSRKCTPRCFKKLKYFCGARNKKTQAQVVKNTNPVYFTTTTSVFFYR